MTAGLEKEKKRILFPQKQTNQNKKNLKNMDFQLANLLKRIKSIPQQKIFYRFSTLNSLIRLITPKKGILAL